MKKKKVSKKRQIGHERGNGDEPKKKEPKEKKRNL